MLTNLIVNLLEIKYGDWMDNKPYINYKSRDKFFNTTMNYIEKHVLDERLRQETDECKYM